MTHCAPAAPRRALSGKFIKRKLPLVMTHITASLTDYSWSQAVEVQTNTISVDRLLVVAGRGGSDEHPHRGADGRSGASSARVNIIIDPWIYGYIDIWTRRPCAVHSQFCRGLGEGGGAADVGRERRGGRPAVHLHRGG